MGEISGDALIWHVQWGLPEEVQYLQFELPDLAALRHFTLFRVDVGLGFLWDFRLVRVYSLALAVSLSVAL